MEWMFGCDTTCGQQGYNSWYVISLVPVTMHLRIVKVVSFGGTLINSSSMAKCINWCIYMKSILGEIRIEIFRDP